MGEDQTGGIFLANKDAFNTLTLCIYELVLLNSFFRHANSLCEDDN